MKSTHTIAAGSNFHQLPGSGIDVAKMPGHWLLARLGKRVLRPGGMELTKRMLKALAIGSSDRVVEFAPGMGRTARMVWEEGPATYTAVERDAKAADQVRGWLDPNDKTKRVITGEAQATGLPDECATVVYGEAMLTMQPTTRQRLIAAEAFRLLKPGGRYGIHELGLEWDTNDPQGAERVRHEITDAIHHQAHPSPVEGWKQLMRDVGFEVADAFTVPMALLEPGRLFKDEGFFGGMRFIFRVLTHHPERRRVLEMRRTFRAYRQYLNATCVIARKPLNAQASAPEDSSAPAAMSGDPVGV